MQKYKHVLGIDLGATNTLACYLKRGRPRLIHFPGGKMLPSALYVDEDGKILIGCKAELKGRLFPAAMARYSKTWIGDNEAKKTWTLRGRSFTPTDVATEILKEVRKNYIKQVQCDENEEIGAVITIPAYFYSNQTDETRKALLAAGFKLLQIITEPMAAAVAALRGLNLENKKILVVDIGGGAFDLSVLEADDAQNDYQAIDVGGDARLGGDDVNELLSLWLMGIIHDKTGVDLSSLEKSALPEETYHSKLAELYDAVEEAKKELSEASEVDISLPQFLPGYNVDICLDRQEFESICQPFFDRVKAKLGEFLDNGVNFAKEELDGIILAGGSCHIPLIQDYMESFNVPVISELDPSTLVALGAAYMAGWWNGGMNVKLKDILSHSLGVEVLEDNQDVFSHLKLLQSQKETISNLQREIEGYIKTTTELRKRLALRDEEYRGLREGFLDFRRQIDKRDQAIVFMESLFDLEEKKVEFEAKKAELEEQARRLKEKFARLEEKSKELESREQALNLSEAVLGKKKTEYECQHADILREKRSLRAEKERLQDEQAANDMLKREYEQREKDLRSLQDECEKLKSEIATLERRKARLEAEGDAPSQPVKERKEGVGSLFNVGNIGNLLKLFEKEGGGGAQ